MMARDQSTIGAKLGPRIAWIVSRSLIHAHGQLIHLKHKLAMMVFHAISDEISDEVDIALGPFLAQMHDALDPSHPAYPGVHFMATASGQLKALAGTGLQISGLLGSLATVMNNELADTVYGIVHTNPHLLPDVSIVVQMAAAGLISPQEAIDAVASQGIASGWTENMITLTKQWPDMSTGLEMIRRGVITPDQFALWMALNGIDESVVGKMLALLNQPISAADAALAVLRGTITQDQANAIALENGITPDNFAILVANTGEPPGLMQLLEGYRRGFIDQATLVKGILQSRYRDEWIPLLEQLRYSPMSVADAVDATVQNQLDEATAESIADQNGLEPGAFATLLATAGEPLSRTEMEDLYNRGLASEDQVIQALRESRLKNKYNDLAFQLHAKVLPIYTVQRALTYGGIDIPHAVSAIMADGYSQQDATEIVSSAQAEQLKTYRDKIVSAVQSLYENNLIDSTDAMNAVTGAGYTTDQANYIIQGSELRREGHLYVTAVNAIRSKYLEHHITSTDASGYLDSIGVPATQRDQLLALWAIEYGAYAKSLTEAQIIKALSLTLITQDDAMTRLTGMGYNETDATLLIEGA